MFKYRYRFSTVACFALSLLLGLLGLGCHSTDVDEPVATPTPEGNPAPAGPVGYQMNIQPFSPTLAHLFDQGGILVLPAGEDALADAAMGDDPVFSALDRYGRLYHFDRRGAWAMDMGDVLPAILPEGQWDVAWNDSTKAVEVLVTAPWLGQNEVQLLRRRQGKWFKAAVTGLPVARMGAHRLFQNATGHWMIAGGGPEGALRNDAWRLANEQWEPWAGGGNAEPATTPRIENILHLVDGPGGDDLGLLDNDGIFWLWSQGVWSREATLPIKGVTLACYDRHLGKALFVWTGEFGQNQILTLPMVRGASLSKIVLTDLSQMSQMTINGQDEGIWQSWGWARDDGDGGSRDFKPGLTGEGEPAVQMDIDQGAAVIRRSQIYMVEMPPRPDLLRPHGAAYVPALGGIVVPSAHGLGLDAGPRDFFPPEMTGPAIVDSATTGSIKPIDVIERTARFWIFRGDLLTYFKPQREVHPAIGYTTSYQEGQQSRSLIWSYPDNGLFTFEYREESAEKVQWNRSPVLTLHDLPILSKDGVSQPVILCDPVVWGDPAEVVLIGWAGRLGDRVKLQGNPEGLGNDTYTEAPVVGFVAKIDALNPRQWQVSSLPIPYIEGGKVVVATDLRRLFLVGGKMAVAHDYEGQSLSFMVSHSLVWQWDGELWSRIEPGGVSPRMKVTSNVAYDPLRGLLLSLTPRAFYGFKGRDWTCLWERDKIDGEQWPTEVGLYVHPLSNLILGGWFMPQPDFKVWSGTQWMAVRMDSLPGEEGPTSVNWLSRDILPALYPDTFVAVDADWLTAIRMDEARERSRDRFLTANMLGLSLEPQQDGVLPKTELPMDNFLKKELPMPVKPLSTDSETTP